MNQAISQVNEGASAGNHFQPSPAALTPRAEATAVGASATGSGGNPTKAGEAMSHYAEGGTPVLTPEQVQKAVAWGERQHLSKDILASIHSAVGVPASDRYDAATAQAVAQAQKTRGLSPDGKAGPQTRETLGLKTQHAPPQGKGGKNSTPPQGQPSKDGVSVGLYNKFDTAKTNKGDLEFERRADDYAKQYQAAGLRGGALAWGQSTPFNGLSGLTGAIQGTHQALTAYAKHGQSEPVAKGGEPTAAPATEGDAAPALAPAKAEPAEAKDKQEDHSTQIRHLAIFTHGMQYGLDTNSTKHTYKDGLHKDAGKGMESNIHQFVTAVSNALTPDVSVQLYACSTGREGDRTPEQERKLPKEGERAGGDSFAGELAQELGAEGHKDAKVFGHLTAAHTTENPYARVYGADAGGDKAPGGQALFELLYPAAFLDSELNTLVPDRATRPPAEVAKIRERLRASMFSHLYDSVAIELTRKNKDKAYGKDTYIGMEAFQDPEATGAKVQSDFQTRWLTDKRRHEILGDTKAPRTTKRVE